MVSDSAIGTLIETPMLSKWDDEGADSIQGMGYTTNINGTAAITTCSRFLISLCGTPGVEAGLKLLMKVSRT